jgi:hypothetical protein
VSGIEFIDLDNPRTPEGKAAKAEHERRLAEAEAESRAVFAASEPGRVPLLGDSRGFIAPPSTAALSTGAKRALREVSELDARLSAIRTELHETEQSISIVQAEERAEAVAAARAGKELPESRVPEIEKAIEKLRRDRDAIEAAWRSAVADFAEAVKADADPMLSKSDVEIADAIEAARKDARALAASLEALNTAQVSREYISSVARGLQPRCKAVRVTTGLHDRHDTIPADVAALAIVAALDAYGEQ